MGWFVPRSIVVVGALVAGACSDAAQDSTQQGEAVTATTAVALDEDEQQPEGPAVLPVREWTSFRPDPLNPEIGAEFEVTFLGSWETRSRSVGWSLAPCDADGPCGAVTHYLTPSTGGYGCADCPRVITVDMDREVDDIAISGIGPDTLALPADIDPGPYQLCVEVRDGELCEVIDVLAANPQE